MAYATTEPAEPLGGGIFEVSNVGAFGLGPLVVPVPAGAKSVIVRDEKGKPVARRAAIKPGQRLSTEFKDGSVKVRAEE